MMIFICGVISLLLLITFNLYKRYVNVRDFFDYVVSVIIKFQDRHPEYSDSIFEESIFSPFYMMTRFWVKDYREFIVDKNLLELVNKDLNNENEELICPWCGNEIDEKEWIDMVEDDDLGCYHCVNCFMYTPISSKEKIKSILLELS